MTQRRDDYDSDAAINERRRLPEMLARLNRLESDVCKYDDKFADLVGSVNSVSMSLHELAARIDTGIKTILIGFGIITTLSGAFWAYQNKVDDAYAKMMKDNHDLIELNGEKGKHD